MAQRQEQLVEEIRAKRADLRRSAARLVDLGEIESHIRREPLPWLLGGAAAGLLVAHWAGGPVLRQTRSVAGRWASSRVRGAVAETIVTVVSDAVRSAATGAARVDVPESPRPNSVFPGDGAAAVTE
ncbi:MAG: hypothetical protein JSW67_10120 [Candidatus Latescibacterota bacterium]|nr:MAG: hypothetical protein JSW67_10120 [Candidatus Latescibacterota bacterium]